MYDGLKTMNLILMYKQILTFLISNFLLLYSLTGWAQSKTEAIEQIFSKFHEYENFQGAVLVAESGEVIYRGAFGLANREWNIPNQIDTKFDIASISKQFTAMLIMQLIEDGKIHLDSTISTYYPEYRKAIGSRVTIHQLLTHQSGIPNYTSLPNIWADSLQKMYTKEELVSRFCSKDLEFTPGSRYQYNNTGYFLLSMIIEKVTGKDFETVLEESILKPLGLRNTGVDQRDEILYKRAYGYEQSKDGYKNAASMYMQNLQGAGNLYATVDDLFAWERALYTDKLVSHKMIQVMQTPHTKESASWIPPYTNTYGYGMGLTNVELSKNQTVPMVFHSGHIKGFSCYMARFIKDEHTVIILSNVGNVSTARMNDIAQNIKNVLYGLPYQVPERSLAPELLQIIDSNGIEAAIAHFYQLKASFPYEFKNAQEDLDQLGVVLVDIKKIPEAIEIFKLNAKTHPSWLAYQRLAIAYMMNNNPNEAAKYYKKAISLNPKRSDMEKQGHAEAKQALKNIQ